MKIIKILFMILFLSIFLYGESVKEMDKRAQQFFDDKKFGEAISLWLNILDVEPENEKIQKKIEMIYELKQKKDIALQKAKLNYKIAKKILFRDFLLGKKKATAAIKNYIIAYRIDPTDSEIRDLKEDMRLLEKDLQAEAKKRRLSMELQAKNKRLNKLATESMKKENYKLALKYWEEILDFFSDDISALEGKRKCRLAIDNRIKFEKIKSYLLAGKQLYEKKILKKARIQFREIQRLDPKNREARDYIERIDESLESQRQMEVTKIQTEEFYNSGLKNLRQNHFDLARDDFESALALINNYRDSKEKIKSINRLKKIYLKKLEFKRKEEVIKKFQDGVLAFSNKKYRDAISSFEIVLSLDSKNVLAKDYMERAKNAQKEVEAFTVDENSPYYDIVHSLVLTGKKLYKLGNYFESRRRWVRILNLFPKNKIAIEFLLRCDLRLNPQSYKKLSKRILDEGKRFLKEKKYEKAVSKFELLKGIDDKNTDIIKYLRFAKRKLKYSNKNKISGIDKVAIKRRYRRAISLFNKGGKQNLIAALNDFKWIKKKDPNNVKAILALNKLQVMLGGSIKVVRKKRNRLSAKLQRKVMKYYYMGINFYSNNQFEKAIQQWRKVLAIDPGNVKARNNIRKTVLLLSR